MADPHDELLLRQRMLLWRSARVRTELGNSWQGVVRSLSWVEPARAGVQWLAQRPHWPLGVAALLLALRPRGVWRWTGRAWSAWRLWRKFSRAWR